jgi:cystathionine beta-lyase
MNPFTDPPARRGTDSIKWARYAGRDVLPLWVADMDFTAPPAVLEALQARVAHGIFGYGEATPQVYTAVLDHLRAEYAWEVDADWLVWLPGLVTGLNVACRSVSGRVLTATPIYPPFLSAPQLSGRSLDTCALVCANQHWQWDWVALEASVRAESELFLLCHPHNPVGRAWQREELERLADFAERHDLIVCSDEIHCGLILDEARRHIPFASLSETAARRSITLMAPSKTYNLPGLGCAFAIIPDTALRRRFSAAMAGIVPHVNVLGYVACAAAYRDAAGWRRELLDVLRRNRDRVESAVAALPGIRMTHVEATYLAWLDVRSLDLADPARHFEAHGLGLNDGRDFGAPGWLRLNFGCPSETLEEALRRLAAGVRAAG